MERALDPELLRLAFGTPKGLPTAEELSELIATAELGLLVGQPVMGGPLVTSAWYLHAVATSRSALKRYGTERQRAAFRVSGHIFDLVLQNAELSTFDRLQYCFAAQVAYLRSELTPNSIALYQRELAFELLPEDLLRNSGEVSLACGAALLGMDLRYLFDGTDLLRSEVETAVREWEVEGIGDTIFAAAAGVLYGVRDLAVFLVYGDANRLRRAREILRRAIRNEVASGDKTSRWVAAHLLDIADEVEGSSIWTALPPDVPSSVRKAFAMVHPKVLTLWPPQLALFGGERNPLSHDVRRLFISTPTSGGKTLIAQLLVATHVATEDSGVCYVAPTRSLCHEVKQALDRRLRYINKRVTAELPEWAINEELSGEPSSVEVMTPERLSFLLRNDSDDVLSRFGLFIFDEVHNVGEAGRGWTLETDLAYLHNATASTRHRIVLMSAVVGNRFHFVEWLGGDDDRVLPFHSDWRGPRRLHCIWTTDVAWKEGQELPKSRANSPRRMSYPLYGALHVLIAPTGRTSSLTTTEPIGQLVYRLNDSGRRQGRDSTYSTANYRMVVPLVEQLERLGPVLVVESTRAATIRMAKAIADTRQPVDDPDVVPLGDLAEARLGAEHPLAQVIRRGVAYHHGSLPGEVRIAIEEAVSAGVLTCLVATTTMTEGVNLPVRSVVIASQGFHGSDGEFREYIRGPKLVNAIGRAGRAAKETEGVVVLARSGRYETTDFERLSPDDEDITVTSTLATQAALTALAEFEALRLASEDAVFETGRGPISDFLAFIWWCAAELERVGRWPDLEAATDVIRNTLGWVQLSRIDRERWLRIATLALQRYAETDPASRRRWALSGTSLGSARALDVIAQELLELLGDGEDTPTDPEAVLSILLSSNRLERLLALPEAPSREVYTQRGGHRNVVDVPFKPLLLDWIRGVDLLSLSEKYLKPVTDPDYRFEQLGDYVYDYFEFYLPWVFSSLLATVNRLALEAHDRVILPVDLPAYVRWGINSREALQLILQGIRSRQLAMRIVAAWVDSSSLQDVRSWVCSMNIVEWQDRFAPSISELRNLLEYCRERGAGIAAQVLGGETTEIQVESRVMHMPGSGADLRQSEQGELAPIGIWVRHQMVGTVPAGFQSDLVGLLRAGGVRLDVTFRAENSEAWLTLSLAEVD